MTAPPLIFADTNVLYASATRDILIELALDDLIRLRWSPAVLDELSRALVRNRSDYTEAKALRLIAAMTGALPEAWVLPPEPPTLAITLPDPKDVHVVAAAHHGACPTILTFNLSDFPAATLAALTPPVAAVHPDAFLVGLLTTNAANVLAIIERVRQNLTTPPMTVDVYADSLARSGLPQTAELLRHLLIG